MMVASTIRARPRGRTRCPGPDRDSRPGSRGRPRGREVEPDEAVERRGDAVVQHRPRTPRKGEEVRHRHFAREGKGDRSGVQPEQEQPAAECLQDLSSRRGVGRPGRPLLLVERGPADSTGSEYREWEGGRGGPGEERPSAHSMFCCFIMARSMRAPTPNQFGWPSRRPRGPCARSAARGGRAPTVPQVCRAVAWVSRHSGWSGRSTGSGGRPHGGSAPPVSSRTLLTDPRP
jgi:hypothetical protein